MSLTRHEVVLWAAEQARRHRLEESTWRLTAANQDAGRGAILAVNPRGTAEACAREAECCEFIVRALREPVEITAPIAMSDVALYDAVNAVRKATGVTHYDEAMARLQAAGLPPTARWVPVSVLARITTEFPLRSKEPMSTPPDPTPEPLPDLALLTNAELVRLAHAVHVGRREPGHNHEAHVNGCAHPDCVAIRDEIDRRPR